SSYVLLMLFFSLSYSALLYTLSFPTRRSSDLAHIGDVLVHLLDQAVHIGEGDLPADAGDELEGHLPVVDVEGSELLVENVRLDPDRKSTRLNSSHVSISYAVFCLKKKTQKRC